MTGADIVIGWVKDDKPFLTDRYAEGQWMPEIDEHNDYHLTFGEEKNGKTILKFYRKIDTCDKKDIKLTEGTTKVIFALNDEDPVSPTQMKGHTPSDRNARSILLLNSQGNRDKPDPSWSSFNILNKNYEVPSKHTTYHCSVHKIPDFPKKNHVIRFDPVVQQGNEGVVHHFIVMACDKDFPGVHLNASVDCDDYANMPAEVMKCRGLGVLAAAWGVGGGPFVYPQHVGFPIDAEHIGRYFVMEVHYDNPDHKSGIIDNSGVRFFYTPNLRKYDAGVFTVGSSVSPWLMVPPKQRKWLTTSSCSRSCTEKHLKNSSLPETGIKIFSAFLHTHLSGRAAWTQHTRDGKELPEIARDDNYDFNFQDIQFLRNEVHLKPGDEIIHNCVYNTMDRTKLTFGGDSTRDEMCLNFVFYYPFLPKLPRICTALDLKAGVAMMDKHYPAEDGKNASLVYNPIKRSHVIWTPKMTDEYKQLIADDNQLFRPFCSMKTVFNNTLRDSLNDADYQGPKVKITTPLPAPKDQCDVYSSAVCTSGYLLYQILTVTFIILTQW
ncbi:DBH-like monooxygenase protein 1 isoform X2 [Actinia tenebrosa]|nr:DBH-like monooxygenase protein 1 isoform X2 [Actinia tenebrosa]XP_031554210.1 DBH-like monooxygenase protein 1 isoform X2 [Actinia tenebrosa]